MVVATLAFFERRLGLIRWTGRVRPGAGRGEGSGRQQGKCQTIGLEARHVNPFQVAVMPGGRRAPANLGRDYCGL
jgi:hypothetical protein